MTDITCDGCFQTLSPSHFGTQSRELFDHLGGLWCCTCIRQEQLHLPRRVPTFGGSNKPAGEGVGWVVDHFLAPENPLRKNKKAFSILVIIAGYIDNSVDDIAIRDLYQILDKRLSNLHIIKIIHQLEMSGWLIVHWALEPQTVNKYSLNYERTPVIHHDPHEQTYNRKETK